MKVLSCTLAAVLGQLHCQYPLRTIAQLHAVRENVASQRASQRILLLHADNTPIMRCHCVVCAASFTEELVRGLVALGGTWRGGEVALKLVLSEQRKSYQALVEEREAVRCAKLRVNAEETRCAQVCHFLDYHLEGSAYGRDPHIRYGALRTGPRRVKGYVRRHAHASLFD